MSKNITKIRWDIRNVAEADNNIDLARLILLGRGYKNSEIKHFLSPSYTDDLADPFLLSGMSKAVDRIYQAVTQKQNIVIYGDYDIDGITASALLYDFLLQSGAVVSVYIPDRFEEGYGLNSKALKQLKKQNTDLVITVDCGITAEHEAVLAQKIGLDLIITDHHTPPKSLPVAALAVINPKLIESKYPFVELAGVGVAFCLVRAMIKKFPALVRLGQEKWLLDLVALGTVCDVVPLVGENRVLVSYGLKVLQKTRRKGLIALAKSSGTEINNINESDLGFRLGPRLNAAGRLEHAKIALNLLLSNDANEAESLAIELNDLNHERQVQTQEIFESANKQAIKQNDKMILVLADSEWSSGVVGIVASRIAEKWHKPAILLQVKAGKAKGSARSYGEFSLIDALKSCSQLFDKYGGHKYAAGMTLREDNIKQLSHSINKYALENIDIDSLLPRIKVDVKIVNFTPKIDNIINISKLRPHGNGNNQPIFASNFQLLDKRLIGQDNNHVKFIFKSPHSNKIDGIAFNSAHKWPSIELNQNYEVAYYLQENIWQNISKVQIEVIDIKNIKE